MFDFIPLNVGFPFYFYTKKAPDFSNASIPLMYISNSFVPVFLCKSGT